MRESSAQNSQRMFGRTDVLKSLSATDAAALNSVTTLDLSKRGIKSIDFDFGELPALRVLNLSGNELTALPKSIGKLTKLTFLNVASNKLRALPDISALVELRSILANDNELTEVAPLSSLLELCTLGAWTRC
jgi:Leucine-rich repeat (LRR) protein